MGNRWKEMLGLMISRRPVIIGSIVKTVDQPWSTRKWLLLRIWGPNNRFFKIGVHKNVGDSLFVKFIETKSEDRCGILSLNMFFPDFNRNGN